MSGVAAFVTQAPPLGGALFGFLAGVLIGLVHFGSLRWNTRIYARGGSLFCAMSIQLFRFAALAAACFGLAKLGASPLLAGLLGVLAARAVLLRRIGGVP